GQRGADQLVLEQRSGHVGEHGVAVGTGAVELAACFLVAHGWVPGECWSCWSSLSPSWRCCFGLRWSWPAVPWPARRGSWDPSAMLPVRPVTLDRRRGPPCCVATRDPRAGDACRHRPGPHVYPIMPCEEMPAGGQFSSFMPSDRPRWASTSLISVSDFLPRFGVLSSSTSVFWIRSPM